MNERATASFSRSPVPRIESIMLLKVLLGDVIESQGQQATPWPGCSVYMNSVPCAQRLHRLHPSRGIAAIRHVRVPSPGASFGTLINRFGGALRTTEQPAGPGMIRGRASRGSAWQGGCGGEVEREASRAWRLGWGVSVQDPRCLPIAAGQSLMSHGRGAVCVLWARSWSWSCVWLWLWAVGRGRSICKAASPAIPFHA